MKKVLGALLLFAVFSACSHVEVPEESSLETDLGIIATRAMATVQPYWDKVTITPVFPKRPPVTQDSMSVNPPQPSITYPTDEELSSTLTSLEEEYCALLEKYDKLDEWSIFSSIDSIEQYFVFVDTVLCSVDVDAILKKCTTSRYQEIHYGIVHDNVVPTIQQVAGDPSLKLIEKILLSEMIGVSIYQLDAELESDPPTRRPVYYNHASECDKAKKAKIKNCNFNYQVDKFASYTCAIGMSVGNLIHLVGHVAIEEVAREAERKRDRCIQNARDWWAECIAHAMYD